MPNRLSISSAAELKVLSGFSGPLHALSPKQAEVGEGAFGYSAPSAWNQLQDDLKFKEMVSLNVLNLKLKTWGQIL